jgi:Flp pilus assembly protein TadG
MLVRFLRNREAGIAPMLALAALPLFGFAGAAVDFSHASAVRTSMQAALDATALKLSKKLKNSPDTPLSSTATIYFNANFVRWLHAGC